MSLASGFRKEIIAYIGAMFSFLGDAFGIGIGRAYCENNMMGIKAHRIGVSCLIIASISCLFALGDCGMDGIRLLRFSPDGKWLSCSVGKSQLALIRLESAEKPLLVRHKEPIKSLVFSADSKQLYLGDEKGVISGYNPVDGRVEFSYPILDDAVVAIAPLP